MDRRRDARPRRVDSGRRPRERERRRRQSIATPSDWCTRVPPDGTRNAIGFLRISMFFSLYFRTFSLLDRQKLIATDPTWQVRFSFTLFL